MLFDEDSLAVFKDKSEKTVFNEILESYYSHNYRSSIVSLYSLVIYDLFLKLNEMTESGNNTAKLKLKELTDAINNPEVHYSDIEKNIVAFFKENYSIYFKKFSNDIEYLTVLRHKCAHLYLSDNGLFVPSQAQTKMLIESMFINLFKVDAPFIGDLFETIRDEIENYDTKYDLYFENPAEIRKKLSLKYYQSMLDQSLSKTINTLFRLMFITKDEDALTHIGGMYVFLDSILWYCNSNGKINKLDFQKIENNVLKKLDWDSFNNKQLPLFIAIGNSFQIIRTIYSKRDGLIQYLKNVITARAIRLIHYHEYFTTEELFSIFLERRIKSIWDGDYYELYTMYVDELKMDKNEFFEVAFKTIDTFNSYSTADVVTKLFMNNFDGISEECLKKVLDIYNANPQCYRRENNDSFVTFIKEKNVSFQNIDLSEYVHIGFSAEK